MNRDLINIIASQRLVEMLSNINHSISKNLLEQIRYRNGYTISYLDFGESSDSISFIYSNKVYELRKEFEHMYTEKVWKNKRSEMKIGKVIKMLYGDRYPINNPKDKVLPNPPVDIESFVNMYKAEREKNVNYDRFSIVTGDEIVYWYNYKNYTRFVNDETPLGKSCLRYEESAKFLEMYLKNSDKISMLILKDDQNKLRGRAIVWKLDLPDSRIYMDRIYTVNDFDVELFKDYAKRNGWFYKERQTYGWNNYIIDSRDNSRHTPKDLKLQIELTNKKIKYYPYLDTLSVFNKNTGVLNNNGELLRIEGHIHLIDYQGSYVDEVDHREYVYSNYYNEDILREESVFCQIDDDWVYEDDSVYVHNTDGLRSIKTSDKIVCSTILNKKKYFLKEDCIYSEYMNTWIFKDSVRVAFLDGEKTQKVIIHFKLINKTFIKNSNGDIIKGEPKKEEIKNRKKSITDEQLIEFINSNSSFISPFVVSQLHSNSEQSNEEEGNGNDRPLPRGRRRTPTRQIPRPSVFGNREERIGNREERISDNLFTINFSRSRSTINDGGDVRSTNSGDVRSTNSINGGYIIDDDNDDVVIGSVGTSIGRNTIDNFEDDVIDPTTINNSRYNENDLSSRPINDVIQDPPIYNPYIWYGSSLNETNIFRVIYNEPNITSEPLISPIPPNQNEINENDTID